MNNQIAIRTYVIKKGGSAEPFNAEKLLYNLEQVTGHLNINVELWKVIRILDHVMRSYGITRITSVELSKRVALMAMNCQEDHPDFGTLARHIELTVLHNSTSESFAEVMRRLYNYRDPITHRHSPLISQKLFEIVEQDADEIQRRLIFKNDDKYNYLALRILQESYLLRIDGEVVERPQHMLMRVALAVWQTAQTEAFEVYDSLSNHYFVPSDLMLRNAGKPRQQCQASVAFTLTPDAQGVFAGLNLVKVYAKMPADVGIGISEFISDNQPIPESLNYSRGVSSLAHVFYNNYSNIPRHIPGPVTFYLEIWHKDIYDFVFLHIAHPSTCFNFNVVIPNLFMTRLATNQLWSLMCPSKCGELVNAYGQRFNDLYQEHENNGQFEKTVRSSSLWDLIIRMQAARGYPSIIFKDNITEPSNYKHLGPITVSNKYTNFAMHSSRSQDVSAHTAYLILPEFGGLKKSDDHETCFFDFHELERQVEIVANFLNQAIDVTDYETRNLKRHNLRHRPLAIGVHGLSDLFQKLRLTYTELTAKELNKNIFEAIYYHALEASCKMARNDCRHYHFSRTPMQRGNLHIDHWQLSQRELIEWEDLRDCISRFGVRNSALISLKSDKITSEIMGVSNSVEPNISVQFRIERFGDRFKITNEQLMRALIMDGNWNNNVKQQLNLYSNSISEISQISESLRNVFKTATEILPSEYISMAKDRAPYVDQSQSTKIFFKRERYSSDVANQILRKAWNAKLKTIYKVVIPNRRRQYIRLAKDGDSRATQSKLNVDICYLFTSIKSEDQFVECSAEGTDDSGKTKN